MKPTTLRWIAVTSALVLATVAVAGRRPYYGGTLRIEIRTQVRSLDPAEPVSDPMEFAAKSLLSAAASGPFKVARWDASKGGTLIPNEDYAGARPYLDSIEIQMSRDLKDQALDFSLGKADIRETGERRGPLVNTLALVFDGERIAPKIREALSLAIDRRTIQKVLLKDQGEPANALLPEWFSGYAFLFERPRDVARSRQLAASSASLTFSYDRQDAIIRRIAERIAVNAMEVGISMRSVISPAADVRLELLRSVGQDEISSLRDLAALLKLGFPSSAPPYDAEHSLLDGFRVIPILHLADSWAVSPRVHNWPDLPNVWVNP